MSNKTRVSFDVVYDEYGRVEFLPLRPERELPDGFMEELCGLARLSTPMTVPPQKQDLSVPTSLTPITEKWNL